MLQPYYLISKTDYSIGKIALKFREVNFLFTFKNVLMHGNYVLVASKRKEDSFLMMKKKF